MKLLLGLVIVFSLVISVCGVDAEPKTLKVGAVLALSGSAAVHGQNLRNGIELAKAGLEGRGWQVDLRYEDDGTSAARSVTAVQALLSRGFRLFIGPTWSFQVEAAASIYSKHEVLAFAPATCSAVTGGPHPHLFHGTSSAAAKEAPLAKWLAENGFKRAAILYAAGAWGDLHGEVYKAAAARAGAVVVFRDKFEYGQEAQAIPVMLPKLRESRPDVILHTSSGEGIALLIRKMAELQMKLPLLSTDDMNDAVEQRLIDFGPATPPLYALTLPISSEFKARYHAHYGRDPGIYADAAYDGLMILAQAKERSDGSPAAMEQYMRQDLSYKGAAGEYRYNQDGDVQRGGYQITRVEAAFR